MTNPLNYLRMRYGDRTVFEDKISTYHRYFNYILLEDCCSEWIDDLRMHW